jgi:peptide/nickel transport system substrate-binding protein
MRTLRIVSTLVALTLIVGMVASCACPTPAPEETEAPTQAPTEAAPTAVPTEAPTEEPPPELPTFIFGRGGDSIQLYPAVVTDGESFRVTGQILEPLFQYEDGGTTPIPALGTDYSISADGMVWTINLREGVMFHDGTPFNADAVVVNFERQWKTDHPLHFESETYSYWQWMWGGFDDESIITGVEAVSEYTVEFTLSEPLAPMLANLAMDMFAISSPTAMEEQGEAYGTPSAGAVGTGPFKFVEWVEDDHITVEANEDYWGGAPTIGGIIWRVIPDDSARYLALKAGEIHAMEQAGIEDIRDCEADDACFVEATGLNTGYLAFNYHIEELRDPLVREAVFHAIDREALREAFYGEYGEVPTTFLHPSMWGRPDLEPWSYDPDLSMDLLEQAGFPDGLTEVTNMDTGEVGPLKLYYMPVTRFYYPSPKEIGEAMAADLAKVGIETELILEGDWPAYLAAAREGRLYGLYMLGWGGDNGDPDNFLCYFFCRCTDEESAIGQGWYVNPELAQLLKDAAVATDLDARAEMYKQAEQMLYDDRVRLWVMHNNTPRLFNSVVSGFVVQPVGADKYEGVVIAE